MTLRLQYGTTAKVFHWTIVALLAAQYPVGWLMPDVHRGMQPGAGMTFHVSMGLIILVATALRLIWRLSHPVAPESLLPTWQRLTSEVVHWMLYVHHGDRLAVRLLPRMVAQRAERPADVRKASARFDLIVI